MKSQRVQEETASPADAPTAESDLGIIIGTHRTLALLVLASLILQSLIFEPVGWWPIAFVCLVPWLLLVGGAGYAPRVYFYSYLLALAFFLINLRWLWPATGLGYGALSAYLAVYFPLMACALRSAVRRRRWPLAVVFPIVWVGSEILRAVVISGFPWFFLSHSLCRVLTLTQVSDLVGAYGVSFVVAAVNGAVADLLLAFLSSRREAGLKCCLRQVRRSLAWAGCLVIASVIYSQVRLHQNTSSPGPKIAILQGDFLSLVSGDRESNEEKRRIYFAMMDKASEQEPDLYLLPESPWIMYLNPEARDFHPFWRGSFDAFQQHATRLSAYIVTGSATLIRTPLDLLASERRHNSATVFKPDGSEAERYDKVHLVYFGEIVPFRFGRLRFLYFWLNRLMPFSNQGQMEYSLFPGEAFHSFTIQPTSQPGTTYRFGIPICYEDVMPYVSRKFVAPKNSTKQVDFLLNISNDGWFGRGVQQSQHLAICTFRAIENRVGIARAVNTGVSAFIQPTGRVHDEVMLDPQNSWPGNCGYAVANVGVDTRCTVYSRLGDWFAWACAAVWMLLFLDYWLIRARVLREN